ncbi:MAG: alpha/beta hydrolase family protein [Planctomycetota bacterium]
MTTPPRETDEPRSFELELPVRAGVPTTRRVVRGRVHGASLDGTPRAGVMLVHGYLAFMDWAFLPALTERLVAAGFAVVTFNLSGSGVGPELDDFTDPVGFAHNTYEQELEDVDAVTRALADGRLGAIDTCRVGLWGHSRGSAMAVLHAARELDRGEKGLRYRALCTWASAAYVGRYEPQRLEEWRRNGHLWVQLADGRRLRLERDLLDDFESRPTRLDVLAAAARLDVPVQLLQGERDRSVLESEAAELIDAYPEGRAKLEIVPSAGHNFGARHPLEKIPPQLETALAVTSEHFERYLSDD